MSNEEELGRLLTERDKAIVRLAAQLSDARMLLREFNSISWDTVALDKYNTKVRLFLEGRAV
jgi:hypothetical protein